MSALEFKGNGAIEGTETATKFVVFLEEDGVCFLLRRRRDCLWIKTQKVLLPNTQFEPRGVWENGTHGPHIKGTLVQVDRVQHESPHRNALLIDLHRVSLSIRVDQEGAREATERVEGEVEKESVVEVKTAGELLDHLVDTVEEEDEIGEAEVLGMVVVVIGAQIMVHSCRVLSKRKSQTGPLLLHQITKAPDRPALGIKDDLHQGRDDRTPIVS